ncbi:hypothetical protein ANN_01109 [Periplaneta americana]|uniref:Uncharacterized protein n=1 Tax=Periplaneta americana TaxID=6978 RepID=A0ABQ8TVQ0_PERAM|nr:hypothetical protein ANN_01109 [Periplaneta americana]
MAGLCEDGNEPPGSLKAITIAEKINLGVRSWPLNLTLDKHEGDFWSRSAEDAPFSIKSFLGHCYPPFDFLVAAHVTLKCAGAPSSDTIVIWSARSPDLTPLDFFLWGCMKEKVYQTETASREEVVTKINTAAIKLQHGLDNV